MHALPPTGSHTHALLQFTFVLDRRNGQVQDTASLFLQASIT